MYAFSPLSGLRSFPIQINHFDAPASDSDAEVTGSSCLCLLFPNDCFESEKCFAKIFCISTLLPKCLEKEITAFFK